MPTGPLGGVLALWRDAVDVFCSPYQLGHLLGESYPSAEMQSAYSAALDDWTTRWGSLTYLQRCSRCILQPLTTRPLVGDPLPLCKDAVGVFCSPWRLGHSLGIPYLSAKMQSVYSAALDDWATRWGSLTSLQRRSRCILQPLTTRPLVGDPLPLCKYAFGVFCSP